MRIITMCHNFMSRICYIALSPNIMCLFFREIIM